MNVHGTEYATLAQVTARLATLAHDDARHGASDGRATERAAIVAALDVETGGAAATAQLFANAEFLGKHAAPILTLAEETDIVRHNVTSGGADVTPPADVDPAAALRAARSAALRAAALESVAIESRGADGHRVGDPLLALIPGDYRADADTLAKVESITGRHVDVPVTAPGARAALRRWAVAQ